MTKPYTKNDALRDAVYFANRSPCAKSKRGVVIFNESGICAAGYNAPPEPFVCTGDNDCRDACGKTCVHAEQAALLEYDGHGLRGQPQMLHVKTVDGVAVPSGPPSCWQCSKLILASGIVSGIWLLHEDGLRLYDPVTFHRMTLQYCSLPGQEGAP
jgi:deoxycytidylate deaminase